MKERFICFATLLLTLSGCWAGSSRYLMVSPLPPHTGPVRILLPGQPTPASFEEIAILQSLSFKGEDISFVTAKLVSDAAAVGCDTIINFRPEKSDLRWDMYGKTMWTAASGTCGRVRQDPGQPVTAPGAVR